MENGAANETSGDRKSGMSAPTAAGTTVAQFSGEFIELAVLFFLLAIVAAVLGARGVAGVSMAAARWLIIAFLVLALVTAVL